MADYSLTWAPASAGGALAIDNHDVEYTPSGGVASVEATGSASGSYLITGLADGVVYSFRVRSKSGGVSGPWSTSAFPSLASLWSVEATGKIFHWSN